MGHISLPRKVVSVKKIRRWGGGNMAKRTGLAAANKARLENIKKANAARVKRIKAANKKRTKH